MGMNTEFFSRIKNIGSLLGRDFAKIQAKAVSLRKTEGVETAAAFLTEVLVDTSEKVEPRQLESYVACRLLLAECQAECGVLGNSPRQVLEGLQLLLKLPAEYPSLIQDGSSRWPELLGKAENVLRVILDPQWVPNSNKSAFVPELVKVAGTWLQLKKPQFAQRVCQMGLGVFPADGSLMLVLAEADASTGDFAVCLESLKPAIRSGANPHSPGKIVALLEMVLATGDPRVTGLATALLGEVYCRLGRWEQALTTLQKVAGPNADNLEDATIEALLVACSRQTKLEEFEKQAQRFLKRSLSAELLGRVAEEVRQMLTNYPHRKRLWLVSGAIALRAGRGQEAVMAFRQAFLLDRSLATEVVEWYRVVGAYTTADGGLCLNLAQVLFRAGQADESLKILARLDSDAATPTQLDEAVALCRELVDRLPDHLEARASLVRLLLRQGDREGALAVARRTLTLAGAAKAVVDLCVEVAQKAQQDANTDLLLPALQLEIEALLKVPDFGTALDRLETLAAHEAATPDRLVWTGENLRLAANQPGCRHRARALLGDLFRRVKSPREAAEQYLLVLTEDPTGPWLERACTGFAQVWKHDPDKPRAQAALAAGWLRLGRAREAREPLFACLEQKRAEGPELLELLAARLGEAPNEPEWLALALEADLRFGDELALAAAVDRLQRLLERVPACAGVVEESARKLEAKIKSPETRQAAILLQLRAQAVSGQFARLATAAQAVADQHPTWLPEIVKTVGGVGGAMPAAGRAHIAMILGRLLAGGGAAEAPQAVALFAQAAQLDLKAWGEAVVAETGRIAAAPGGFAGAILVALRTAIQMGRGAALGGDLLQCLDRLSDAEVKEARELVATVLKQDALAAALWLAQARCDLRLQNLAAALAAYRCQFALPAEAFASDVLADLRQLQEAHPASREVFLVSVDGLLWRGDVAAARTALLKRIPLFPAETAECLERIERLQQRADRSWEDGWALAEALRIAGQPAQALQIWHQVLAAPEVDWARCATGLQQLCLAMPKDFQAGALLVRAEARALPVEKLKSVVRRLERVLALADPTEAGLQALSEDCAIIEQRARDREDVLRMLGLRRAQITALRLQHEAAAAELDRFAARWPAEAGAVMEFCQQQLGAGAPPVYHAPLAQAAFLAGDFQVATDALRQLVAAVPEQRGQARKLCHEFFGKAQGPAWELIQLLRADLAAQAGDYRTMAQLSLALADRAPGAAAVARGRLLGLTQQGVDAPEIYLALADLALDGKAENIAAACDVIRQFLARDPTHHFPVALDYLQHLKQRFPDCIETRLHLLGMFAGKPVLPAEDLAAEAEELFRDFGPAGATAFLEFCQQRLTPNAEQAPLWHLKCAAHELLGDLPGSLQCLQTLIQIDQAGQAAAVMKRAAGYLQPGGGPASVVVFLADLARATGDFAVAADQYAAAVELPEADFNLVREGLRSILKADPTRATTLGALARCEWKAGNPAAAARYYQLAGEQGGSPALTARLRELCEVFRDTSKCWFVRAQDSLRHGDTADAFAALKRICPSRDLERDEQIRAWRMLADGYAQEGQFDEAIRIMRRVVETEPADDSAARRLISLYFDKNTHRLAQVRAALESGPRTPELMQEAGDLLKARGDYAEAVRWYRQVPREHPLAAGALMESGKCHLALNQCHLAAVAFKGVLILGPATESRREALYHLGLAHTRLLEFDAAVRVFEELCVEAPGYRDAAEQLRRTFEHLEAGPTLRMAEVPFDVLNAWRQLAADTPPAAPAPPPSHA